MRRALVPSRSETTRETLMCASDVSERNGATLPAGILVTMEFAVGATAARFERYLKSGSGRAFAKGHFAPIE